MNTKQKKIQHLCCRLDGTILRAVLSKHLQYHMMAILLNKFAKKSQSLTGKKEVFVV